VVSDRPSPWRAIVAATALNAPVGALYSYSVFLRPLEALLGLGRADLAIVFAIAAAGFGVGMMLAPMVYRLASPAWLVLLCAGANALGFALTATAGGLLQLALGYGLLFGIGGGAAYILVQQMVNLAITGRHGLINGYLVSLLPMGAMITTPLFGWAIREFGVRATLGGFAAALFLTGLLSAWLTHLSGVTLHAGESVVIEESERRHAVFWRLSIVFFLAASAGLMVLSQAAGIISAYGGAVTLAVYGTTFITAMIAAARITGGWLVDWIAIPNVAAGAAAISFTGNVALTLWPGPRMAVAALLLVGVGYGLTTGLTAASVAVYWRRALYGRMAARVYIAWCAAAIVLPVIAGRLFDATQGYGTAVMLAGAGNAVAVVVARGLPRQANQ
jgi:hypothetical protein